MKNLHKTLANTGFSGKHKIGITCLALFPILLMAVATATASEKRLSVKVPLANIRSGPGTEHRVLWKVEKFHPVKVVETQGKWCRFVDFEGDGGWLFRSLLSTVETVIVKKNICNVRSGPGTQNEVVFKSEKGVPYKVLKRQGDWIRVLHVDGDTGWIHNSLVW